MEKKLKVVRGCERRGDEVIALLKSWGGENKEKANGDCYNMFYYLNTSSIICCDYVSAALWEFIDYEEIKLPEPKKDLPKTWVEFCNNYRLKDEWYFNSDSALFPNCDCGKFRNYENDKNLLPNEETAKAVLALCQLIQLRDCYNNGWQPDWTSDTEFKYGIEPCNTGFSINKSLILPQILFFKTAELRDEFYKNFIDLIETIKPLFGIMEGGEK